MSSATTSWPVEKTTHSIKQFVSWYSSKSLILKPQFQRNEIWSPMQKSFLMDSIIRGFPLPLIILRDSSKLETEQKLEVVDGQQRLSSILAFVAPAVFPESKRFLISPTHNVEFASLDFQNLPPEVKQIILNYQLSVHILPTNIPDPVVLQLFSRLNSTGTKLNDQELRNAEFYGEFKQFVETIGTESYWFWEKYRFFNSNSFARMLDRRFVAELVHRMLYGTSAMTKATLNKLYRDFNEGLMDHHDIIQSRFLSILDYVDENLRQEMIDCDLNRLSWFYTLFGKLFDFLYGDVEDYDPTIYELSDATLAGVKEFAYTLASLPADELKKYSARTTNLDSRKKKDQFFDSIVN